MVQMISNQRIDRLLEVDIVKSFIHRHGMLGKLCIDGDNFSFILYKIPYVIEFHDALIENYLEISLSDMSSDWMIDGGSALGCSIDIGLQNLEKLRNTNHESSIANTIFLSENFLKTRNLYSNLGAIDKLLPHIEAKGGLISMRDKTFDERFDFNDTVKPMYFGLKDKYLNCINKTD